MELLNEKINSLENTSKIEVPNKTENNDKNEEHMNNLKETYQNELDRLKEITKDLEKKLQVKTDLLSKYEIKLKELEEYLL